MLSRNKRYANEILDDIECYKAVLQGKIKKFPNGFWTKPWSLDSAAIITRYLLEERLKYTEEDIKTKVNAQVFIDNKLVSLIRTCDESLYKVIDNAYPGKFKPWELSKVPRGFWEDQDNIIEAIRWLVETKLGNSRERVCKEFNTEFLMQHKLGTLSRYGIHNLINQAYPDEFKPWELGFVSEGFWDNKENVKEAIRWLIETKLGNNRERVCKEFDFELLTQYNLRYIQRYGMYNLLNMTYPNEFKPWELKSVSHGFWEDENNIIEAVRWVIDKYLDNNRERVCREFTREFLINHGLKRISDYGLYKMLDLAYPNEFKPWELNMVSKSFWQDENNVREATRWLVETKLDNNRERVCKEFTKEFIYKHRVPELARIGLYKALNMTYPNEFKPWELSGVTKGFWEDEANIKVAVKWVIENRLGNNKERVKKEFSQKLLKECGLTTLTKIGIYNLLDMTFPNEFQPSDFTANK